MCKYLLIALLAALLVINNLLLFLLALFRRANLDTSSEHLLKFSLVPSLLLLLCFSKEFSFFLQLLDLFLLFLLLASFLFFSSLSCFSFFPLKCL